MNKRVSYLTALFIYLLHFNGFGYHKIHKDTLPPTTETAPSYKLTVLTYARIISDAKGLMRADENIVPKFRLLNWLKLETGFRYGERPQNLNSYYHYKLELQTKYFLKTIRFIGRISDNVINYPDPSYRKTNELFAFETKFKLSRLFQGLAAGGYVFSTRQNNSLMAEPTFQGTQANYPIFKLSVRYLTGSKGFFELVYGSYDVFNPYEINRPFTQITWEREFMKIYSFYSYARYQYDYNILKPYNYFLGVGVMIHLFKN
jgi:hypothetical protein